MSEYLFIYGSLITGTKHPQINRCIQRDCVSLGSAHIKGKLFDLGSYPGAVADTQHNVFGQLLKIRNAAAVLRLLDAYEAYNPQQPKSSEFVRAITTATLLDENKPYRCWIYWYNLKPYANRRIESGNYVAHIAAQRKTLANLRPLISLP